jgi:hypothetical protein
LGASARSRRVLATIAALAIAAATIAVVTASQPAGSLAPGTLERVSLPDPSTGEVEGDDSSFVQAQEDDFPGGQTVGPVVSDDGNRVAFVSAANNLVEENDGFPLQVFVRDRAAGTTEMVSVDQAGDPGDDADSDFVAISGDGNHVAFASLAPLDPLEDEDDDWDVYVRNLTADTTSLVSKDCFEGCSALSGNQLQPAISGDGRYVAYTDLPDGGGALVSQVEVYDRDADEDGVYDEPGDAGEQQTVSAFYVEESEGIETHDGDDDSYDPSISHDGRWIAFTSEATNLGDDTSDDCNVVELAALAFDDDNCEPDVLVADREALGQPGGPGLVSAAVDGTPGDDGSGQASVSGDGRLVAFTSAASDMLPAGQDTNGFLDIYIRDRDGNDNTVLDEPGEATTRRISVTEDGEQVSFGGAAPAISVDGGSVAFYTDAELVAEDTNGNCDCDATDIYLVRLADDHVELVSVDDNGNQAFEELVDTDLALNGGPAVSATGRHVAFESPWPYLAEDTNETQATLPTGFPGAASDVYLREYTPALVITPDPVQFGSVVVGQNSGLRVATVQNVSATSVSLTTMGVSPGGEFSIVDASDCAGQTLAPDGTCQLTLRFRPIAVGARLATLSVAGVPPGAAGADPATASALLQGRGTPIITIPSTPALTITPDPIDFGSQLVGTPSLGRNALVRSVGNAPLSIPVGGVTLGPPHAGDFTVTVDGCSGQTLPPGDSCTITSVFTPTEDQARSAALRVASNAASSPDGVTLRGGGTYAPLLLLSPAVGKRGSVTIAIGSGYPPNEAVLLDWVANQSWIRVPKMVQTDGTGSFQTPILVFGKDRLGPRQLRGTSVSGWLAETVFLAELPTSGPPNFLIRD